MACRAFCYPSLSPSKDMEVLVHGSDMRSPAFQLLFFAALRALIDELGVRTFNAAVYNISLAQGQGRGQSAQQAQQQQRAQQAQHDGAGWFHSAREPVIARWVHDRGNSRACLPPRSALRGEAVHLSCHAHLARCRRGSQLEGNLGR
jgi:hypothetical protein